MQLQGPNAIAKAGLSFLLTAVLSSASEQTQRKPVNLAVVENYLQNAMHGARLHFHDPEATIERMGLHDGQMVADVGSAAGFYTLRLARRVEPHGVVFAVDVQERMLDHLRLELDARDIRNVLPVLGAFDDPHLPPGKFDWVLIVDAYHGAAFFGRTAS